MQQSVCSRDISLLVQDLRLRSTKKTRFADYLLLLSLLFFSFFFFSFSSVVVVAWMSFVL